MELNEPERQKRRGQNCCQETKHVKLTYSKAGKRTFGLIPVTWGRCWEDLHFRAQRRPSPSRRHFQGRCCNAEVSLSAVTKCLKRRMQWRRRAEERVSLWESFPSSSFSSFLLVETSQPGQAQWFCLDNFRRPLVLNSSFSHLKLSKHI